MAGGCCGDWLHTITYIAVLAPAAPDMLLKDVCCCCCLCFMAGGGCGVGIGLGWGYGAAWGSKYIIIEPDFADASKDKKPKWLSQLQQQWRIARFEHAQRTAQ